MPYTLLIHLGCSQGRRSRFGRVEPQREAVARLRIHSPGLNYLREIFKKGAEQKNLKTATYLIDVVQEPDAQTAGRATNQNPQAEVNRQRRSGPGNTPPNGPAAHEQRPIAPQRGPPMPTATDDESVPEGSQQEPAPHTEL
jgi:hypothetical protein